MVPFIHCPWVKLLPENLSSLSLSCFFIFSVFTWEINFIVINFIFAYLLWLVSSLFQKILYIPVSWRYFSYIFFQKFDCSSYHICCILDLFQTNFYIWYAIWVRGFFLTYEYLIDTVPLIENAILMPVDCSGMIVLNQLAA